MNVVKLRAHHLLCISFFIGKGYSEEFIDNMKNIILKLNEEDPIIHITSVDDALCKCCINYKNGICIDKDKVMSYDNTILSFLDLKDKEYHYSELKKIVHDKILTKVSVDKICINCCWKNICVKLQEELYGIR